MPLCIGYENYGGKVTKDLKNVVDIVSGMYGFVALDIYGLITYWGYGSNDVLFSSAKNNNIIIHMIPIEFEI